MKMKLFLIAAMAVVTSSVATAQVSYGVKAGVNLNKTTYEDYPSQFKKSNYPSFFLTAYADFGLGSNFSLQPGLSLQSKGDKYTLDGDKAATWDVMSIEIPVNAVYYIPTGATGSVFVGAGPYIGFNVSGKNKITDKGAPFFGAEGNHNMTFSGSNKSQNVIDAGANFMLGYKLSNGFLINVEYGLGIANLDPHETHDASEVDTHHLHNRTLRFGIGYQF